MILILESSPPWIPELVPALTDLGAEVEVDQDASRTDMRAVRAAVASRRPAAVILSGFRVDADADEDLPDQAFAENAEAAINLAAACMEFKATAVLLSTAEVFGQHGGPFSESDTPIPASTWAESRLKGEDFLVRAARERALVLRLGALVEVEERRHAAGVREWAADERVSPLCAAHLAQAIVGLLAAGARGIFHVASSGAPATRAEVLSVAASGMSVSTQAGASLERRAPRTRSPLLMTTHLSKVLGAPLPDWRASLRREVAAHVEEAGVHVEEAGLPAARGAERVGLDGPIVGQPGLRGRSVGPLGVERVGPDGLIIERPGFRVRSVVLAGDGDDWWVRACADGVAIAVFEGKIAVETEAEDRVIRPGGLARLGPGVGGRLVALGPTHLVVVEEGPLIA